MTMAKQPKEPDIDPRALAADLYRRLGGIDGMTRWAKNKQTLAYGLIANLLKQPASTTFNKVTIKVNEGEDARRKLEDAFMRVIESRKYENVDPAVFVNGERLEPLTIDHKPLAADGISHTRDGRPSADDESPSTDATRPATVHVVETSRDPRPASPDPRPRTVQSFVPGQGAGAALDGADDNRSTTQKYLDWNGHGKLF
jgi:hypothetical protein